MQRWFITLIIAGTPCRIVVIAFLWFLHLNLAYFEVRFWIQWTVNVVHTSDTFDNTIDIFLHAASFWLKTWKYVELWCVSPFIPCWYGHKNVTRTVIRWHWANLHWKLPTELHESYLRRPTVGWQTAVSQPTQAVEVFDTHTHSPLPAGCRNTALVFPSNDFPHFREIWKTTDNASVFVSDRLCES